MHTRTRAAIVALGLAQLALTLAMATLAGAL